MILLNEFVKLDVSDEFYSMFEVVIQLGAILAVVVLFWKDIFPFGKPTGRRRRRSTKGIMRYVKTDIMLLWCKILVSCVPAAIVGILFNDFFEALFYNYITVAIMLILFGVLFIIVETVHKGKPSKINSLSELSFQTAFCDWAFPADRSDLSGHLPLRCNHRRRADDRCIPEQLRQNLRSFSRFRLCLAQAF